MDEHTNGTVLKITRGLIYLMMGLAGLAVLALALGAGALPFFWPEALVEIAKEKPGFDGSGVMPLIYMLFAFAIICLAALWMILKKLLAIIATVAEGDPFVRANAVRLKAIGWIMVFVHVIGIPFAAVATQVGDKLQEADMHGDVSITGILSTLLVFVLAGVFERGAAMREELEGTV
jgi:Protein of unknown function (DUF2975)